MYESYTKQKLKNKQELSHWGKKKKDGYLG